jgi:hypothetical protein
MSPHEASKRAQQATEGTSEVPKPDNPNLAPGENEGVAVAIKSKNLLSLPERAIGRADSACEV